MSRTTGSFEVSAPASIGGFVATAVVAFVSLPEGLEVDPRLLVLSALGMNQQTSRVVMWGYIGRNSPHFTEFAKYIRNVSFGKRPGNLSFGYLFDELQEHHFFDLYATHLLA